MSTVVLLLAGLPLAFALWWLFKDLIVRSPLDNIPGPPPQSWLSGHLPRIFHRHEGWKLHDELSENYGGVSRIIGALGVKYPFFIDVTTHSVASRFQKRVLYVYDPLALHSIVIKDQAHYEEAPYINTINTLMFGPGLTTLPDEPHRRLRKMLTPVFTISHMRHMTPIFYQVAHRLRGGIGKQVSQSSGDVDVLNWVSRTALELVGQGGMGYSFDPLVEDAKNVFGDSIKGILPAMFALASYLFMTPYIVKIGSASFRRWVLDNLVPSSKVQRLKNLIDVLDSESKDLLAKKRKALEDGDEAVKQQIGEGKDIMSVLLRANINATGVDQLSEEELLAQMRGLIFAATDTTSSALAQTLQLLSEYPEVQEKLRQEVIHASGGDIETDIAYDELVDLPYLDAVCRETLRLYPPATDIPRHSVKDMVLPLSTPIRGVDGTYMNELAIPKDTRLIISIRGCNRNKGIWGDDAYEWKPERWLSPLPNTVTDARVPGVYSNMMTFLGGSRSCIGFKFSQLEMKVVLSVLLKNFRFSPSGKKIVWNLGPAKYPTVGRESTHAELPMKVELLKA
ncbi:hypothetical protein NLI96_g9146 [Meripilus lineatus]|uniref:Cytochrome P450 n=1 Tax=Meripilus lineatus TaxID=2056292 RepID=A0AAD5YFJ2_9APHY|nr:hypothetical protein NLI96_g9146 [Physisporinus lineatus]